MLSESPPTEIIGLLQFLVRTVKSGNIVAKELSRDNIPESLSINLVIVSIELHDIRGDDGIPVNDGIG